MSYEKRALFACPHGFCPGVRKSIEISNKELDYRERTGKKNGIYGYPELVHNEFVISDFRQRGMVFTDDIEEVPYGSTIVFSAHGVSPAIRRIAEKRASYLIDTTCPMVVRVHREVRRFASEGYNIILIGQKGHDEVVGTMGEAPDKVHVIERKEDVQNLSDWKSDVAYVSQTTLNLDDCKEIIKLLQMKYPLIIGPSEGDVCRATKNRQEAIKLLCYTYHPELFLIFGSSKSSNTNKLVEVAKFCGVDSYRLDDISKCKIELLDGKRTIGISSGASVPEIIIDQAKMFFKNMGFDTDEIRFTEEEASFLIPKYLKERYSKRS